MYNQNNFRMPFKKKQHFIILYFLLLGASLLMAQKETCVYSLSGKVLDTNIEGPIFNAVIKFKYIEKYNTTSIEGAFKIRLSSLQSSLITCPAFTISSHHSLFR